MDCRAFLAGAAALLAAPLAVEKQRPPDCVAFLTLNPRLRMSSVLSLFLALWLVGCGRTGAVPAGTASAPPPLVARVHPEFWSAVAALDFDGAERLAASASQVEFLAALRDVAEERLVEGQMRLLALARSDDPTVAKRSTALLRSILHERPSWAIVSLAPPDLRALIRAWRDMSSSESWTFPPHPVTHPLQHRNELPLVPVTVNGRRTAFVLDTGAFITVLSSRFASDIGVSSVVAMGIQDVHGIAIQSSLARADVDLGGIGIQGHPVAVLDLGMLEFPTGRMLEFPTGPTSSVKVDGVLGWNAIRELRITLDNDRRVLLLEQPRRRATSSSEFVWVAKPFVRARAGNGLPLALYLDTAAERSLIAPALAAAAGFRYGRDEAILLTGPSGTRQVQATMYAGALLHVGGARVRFRELLARPLLEPIDGVLGSDALTRGRVVIDFQAGEFSVSGAR
jgi:Aspartyl protease